MKMFKRIKLLVYKEGESIDYICSEAWRYIMVDFKKIWSKYAKNK